MRACTRYTCVRGSWRIDVDRAQVFRRIDRSVFCQYRYHSSLVPIDVALTPGYSQVSAHSLVFTDYGWVCLGLCVYAYVVSY